MDNQRSIWHWLTLAIVMVAVVVISGCGSSSSNGGLVGAVNPELINELSQGSPDKNGTKLGVLITAHGMPGLWNAKFNDWARQIKVMLPVPVEVGFLEVTFSRVLYWGWNLITIPVENNYTASTLYGDIPDCNIILGWNASLQDFDIYVPGSPYDFPIENGKGYFIGIAENVTTNNVTFNVTGLPIENVSIPLVTGWNMLGWYHEQPTTGRSIYENITGCTTVLTWNTSMYPPSFDLYAPGVPYNPSINQGDGFLVAVTQPSIWHGEG